MSFVRAAQKNVSSLYITRQKVQMMYLACHYLETFLLFEKASLWPVVTTSHCALEEIKFKIHKVSSQSGLKRILIDIHQASCFNNEGEMMPFREIGHC